MDNWKKRAAIFLTGQGITLFGSSVVQFAIIWCVTLTTSSGLWVTLLTLSAYVPQFIISFFAGVWVDKYSRKLLIIIADSVIAVATLGLAIVFPYISNETTVLLLLVVISIVRSLGSGVQTPAVSAAVTQLVPQDSLMKYNGVNSTIQSLVQFVAPALSGVLLTFMPISIAMYIDVITAAVGIAFLSVIKIEFVRGEIQPSTFSEIKSGINYVIKNGFIGKILLLFGVFIILCVPTSFMSALFVTRYYGAEYWRLSLVEIVGCIGMTLSGLVIGIKGGFNNRLKTFAFGILIFGVLSVAMGAINNYVAYLIMMALYGIGLTMVQTAATTILQEQSSLDMMGKVFGLFSAVYSCTLFIGMTAFGPLADAVSLRLLMIISGAALIILSIIVRFSKNFYRGGIPKSATPNEELTETCLPETIE